MARQPLYQAQFLESLCMVFEIDGSAVTTSDNVSTGLLKGQHLAYIKKGSGADSNLVTITLRRPFGLAPSVLYQPITLSCIPRDNAAPTTSVITIRTLASDFTSQANDCDLRVFVFGTEGIREGKYI